MILTMRRMIPEDRAQLETLLSRIEVFNRDDQLIALELVDYELQNPGQKDYDFFLVFDGSDRLIGYACFGPTPLTDRTYDLYWIAVDPDFTGQGTGRALLKKVEEEISAQNGRMIVIETSSGPEYTLTREFYLKNHYLLAETIKDFFREGEDRVTYVKTLGR
jgi:ribosomal protein S18 acetylase RimI-like enzyme